MEPLFAKSGNSARLDLLKITYTPFLVDKDVVQPIRERALKLIEDNIFQDDTRTRLKALKCLKHALMDPFRFSGLEISEETLKQWVPEQLHVLEMIKKLTARAKDPLVHIAIIDLVGWEAQRGSSTEAKEKAQELIASIEETFEFRLTRVLKNSYLHERRYRRHEDYITWMEQENYELAKQFLEKYTDPLLGTTNLNQRLQLIKNTGIEPQPEQFLGKFADINLEYALAVCELIIKNPNNLIASFFHNILYKIKCRDISRASALALKAIDTDNLILCRSVAFVYQTWRNYPVLQSDFEIIKRLLDHADNLVRKNAILSIGVIAHSERRIGTNMNFGAFIIDESERFRNPLMSLSISANIKRISVDSLNILALSERRFGIDIALEINIGDETELADALCSIFNEKWGIPLEDLTNMQLNLLIRKLEPVKNIDRNETVELLRNASHRVPHFIFQTLLNRIRFSKNYNKDFQPLPYLGFHENIFPNIQNSNFYRDILNEIRIFALENKNNFWIPILFNEISADFSNIYFQVLEEWINSNDIDKIMAIGDLLRNKSPDFIFSYPSFILNLLEHSYNAGELCYDHVSGSLFDAATNTVFHHAIGEPSSEALNLLNKATEALKQCDVGSPSYRYYASLIDHANFLIKKELNSDEDILD